MKYLIALFVFLITQNSLADDGGFKKQKSIPSQSSPNFTAQGTAEIKLNHAEILALFSEIKDILERIDNKEQQIDYLIAHKEEEATCASSKSIKRDLEDAKQKQAQAKSQTLSQEEMNHLNSLVETYNKSDSEYQNKLMQQHITCN
jgi:hypothetical protein